MSVAILRMIILVVLSFVDPSNFATYKKQITHSSSLSRYGKIFTAGSPRRASEIKGTAPCGAAHSLTIAQSSVNKLISRRLSRESPYFLTTIAEKWASTRRFF